MCAFVSVCVCESFLFLLTLHSETIKSLTLQSEEKKEEKEESLPTNTRKEEEEESGDRGVDDSGLADE